MPKRKDAIPIARQVGQALLRANTTSPEWLIKFADYFYLEGTSLHFRLQGNSTPTSTRIQGVITHVED